MSAVIALHNQILKSLKEEWKLLIALCAAVAVILQIAYYKENTGQVIRTAATITWLFIMPGYFLTLHWRGPMGFLERIIIGTIAAMALTGLLSYYLGLLSLKTGSQPFLLPPLIIIAVFSLTSLFSRLKTSKPSAQEGLRQ